MTGINLLRFDLENKNYGTGGYRIGNDVWVDISMEDGNPVVEVWRDAKYVRNRTWHRFVGISVRMIAVKVLEIGKPIRYLPIWRIKTRQRNQTVENIIMGGTV